MSTDDRARDVIAYVGLIIGALLSLTYLGQAFPFALPILVFILVGLVIFGIDMYSSRKTQAAKPMADPTADSVYYGETTPKDAESKTPALSCPDCGYENPGDADFCIRCGRNLK